MENHIYGETVIEELVQGNKKFTNVKTIRIFEMGIPMNNAQTRESKSVTRLHEKIEGCF